MSCQVWDVLSCCSISLEQSVKDVFFSHLFQRDYRKLIMIGEMSNDIGGPCDCHHFLKAIIVFVAC